MMAPSTVPLVPEWLNHLVPDATLTASVLNRSLQGREAIIRVVQSAAEMYEKHTVMYHTSFGNRTLLEYDAVLVGGTAIHGVLLLSNDADGNIVDVGIYHGPVGAINVLSATLEEKLAAELGAHYFRS
jgi:hypothetical protein